jgi:hypothetical protein
MLMSVIAYEKLPSTSESCGLNVPFATGIFEIFNHLSYCTKLLAFLMYQLLVTTGTLSLDRITSNSIPFVTLRDLLNDVIVFYGTVTVGTGVIF